MTNAAGRAPQSRAYKSKACESVGTILQREYRLLLSKLR